MIDKGLINQTGFWKLRGDCIPQSSLQKYHARVCACLDPKKNPTFSRSLEGSEHRRNLDVWKNWASFEFQIHCDTVDGRNPAPPNM